MHVILVSIQSICEQLQRSGGHACLRVLSRMVRVCRRPRCYGGRMQHRGRANSCGAAWPACPLHQVRRRLTCIPLAATVLVHNGYALDERLMALQTHMHAAMRGGEVKKRLPQAERRCR